MNRYQEVTHAEQVLESLRNQLAMDLENYAMCRSVINRMLVRDRQAAIVSAETVLRVARENLQDWLDA